MQTGQNTGRARSPFLFPALMMAQVGQGLSFVILVGVLPQIAVHFGGGAQGELIAQQMTTLPFLGVALGGFLSVFVIGALGLRSTILAAATLFAAAGSAPIWANGAPLMLGACFVLGICAALIVSAMSGMAAELFDGPTVARIISFQIASAIFLNTSVSLVMAFAAEQWGWRAPFLGYVIVGVVTLVLSALAFPSVAARQEKTGGFGLILRHSGVAFVLGFLAFVAFTAHPSFTPFLMAQNGVESPLERQFFMNISTISMFLGSLFYAMLQGKVPAWMTSAGAVFTLAAGLVIFATWTGARDVMAFGQVMFGLGMGLMTPPFYAAVVQANPSQGGQAVGVLNSSLYLGAALTPMLLSPVRGALGIPNMYLAIAAVVVALGAIVVLRTGRGPAAVAG